MHMKRKNNFFFNQMHFLLFFSHLFSCERMVLVFYYQLYENYVTTPQVGPPPFFSFYRNKESILLFIYSIKTSI